MKTASALLLALTACGEEPPGVPVAAPSFHFVDVAAGAGVGATTWCGRPEKPHLLESGGTGLALFDADRDGDLDLYLVNGWRLEGDAVVDRGRDVFYLNRGDGRFDDATQGSGLDDEAWGCGVEVGDVNRDGALDLFVTNFGPDALYLGRGDGTFARAPVSPGIDGWSTGAALFDADRDGDLDLYVAAYVECTLDDVLHAEPTLAWRDVQVMLGPFGLEGAGNRYFVNDGRANFSDATDACGLGDVGEYFSFGVLATDLDDDLDLDLYVANDSNPNYLYRNDGTGKFQEIGLWSGAALDRSGAAQAGMGLASGDVDLDGRVDLFVTNFADDVSTLYLDRGECLFADATVEWGLREPTYTPLSWGTVLEDFDLDGRLDLFIANGHIYPQADRVPDSLGYGQRNLLLAGEPGGFRDASREAGPGLAVALSSRGVAAGDIDGDGDVDLAISNVDGPPTILRNDSPRRGAWLIVDAPGAVRVEARLGERRLARRAVYGGSFCSVSDRRFHFGLGPVESVPEVAAIWPDGSETVERHVAVDRVVRLAR